MARITIIPQTINPLTKAPTNSVVRRRVAGYARVSTDQDEQFTSYQAQVDYYTKYIKERSDWEFVKVYTDEGITGTNTKNRKGFQEMIKDALDGKIDLIVTKSVSRFARNTVDSISTIRKLKERNVEVFFEKENIYTFDGKGELLITIMSSLAQEESRSISENVTWGQRQSFAKGNVHLPYATFLGYEKGDDNRPKIVEEEAKIVRLIYSLFLTRNMSAKAIADELTRRGYKTPRGKDKWTLSTINSILTNEKYKGQALLQKTITVDFLQHKTKKNEGEAPQYYIEDSHEAIIDPEEWEQVQIEMKRRKALGKSFSSNSIFSSKIVCADCGSMLGPKVWHSTDKYRTVIWQCNHKFDKGKKKCQTPVVKEESIKLMFLKAYKEFMASREEFIKDTQLMVEALQDFTELDKEIDKCRKEAELIATAVEKLVGHNASVAQEQEEYREKYEEYSKRYEAAYARYQELTERKNVKISKYKALQIQIKGLKEKPAQLSQWDDSCWSLFVEKAVLNEDKSITFKFYNGFETKIEAE